MKTKPPVFCRIVWPSFGMRAAIEVNISTLMPLPTPRSVISSPSHMMTAVPAVMQMTIVASVADVWSCTGSSCCWQLGNSCPELGQGDEAGGLQDGQADGEVAAVLGQLLLTGLALLLQLLEARDDHDEQLDDDAGGDVGHDAQREHRQPQQRAAGEQVDQRVDVGVGAAATACLMQALIALVFVSGVGTEAPSRYSTMMREREEQLLAQVRRPERRCECAEHGSSC